MNKLFLPLFLIISSVVFGQGQPFPNYQQFGSQTTRTAFLGAPHGIKGVIIGRYADTTTANNNAIFNYIKFYPGAFIVTDNPRDVLWQRNYNATKWIAHGAAGIQNFNDSTVYLINDSTLVICPLVGSCDTINLGTTNTYNIIFDSTSNNYFLVTCDTVQIICPSGPESCFQQQVCDTILIPAPLATIYQNGVRKFSNIVEHGNAGDGEGPSSFYHDTWLHTNYYNYTISGRPTERPLLAVKQNQWSQLSSSVTSFNHYGAYRPGWGLLDDVNPVKLYVNYSNPFFIPTTGALAGDTVGFFGNRYGYAIMTNSEGAQARYTVDDINAKQVGVFFDTYTADNKGVGIFAGQVPSTYNFGNNPASDSTLLSKMALWVKTNQDLQFPNYPNTRDDGGTAKAFYSDNDGNVKYGPVTGGDIITIINDTTFIICSFGSNLCDTIYVTNIGNVQTVTILNDSTLIVCDSVGVCDTLIVNPTVFSQPITANNGLIMSTPTNVQLGSPTPPGAPLLHNTYINAGGFNLTITGTVTPNTAGVLVVNNTHSGGTSAAAIRATTVSVSASSYGVFGSATSGIGIRGIATSGNGGSFTSTSGIALIASSASSTGAQISSTSGIGAWVIVNPSSTATQVEVLRLDRNSSGTPAVGMGGYMSFNMPTTASIFATEAARISAVWSNATSLSQTATLDFWTTNAAIGAIKMQIAGSGAVRMHNYGDGTFTGTATKWAAWDVNGNLIEEDPPSGGGSITADNGLTMSTATNVQLFGTVGAPALLLNDRYLDQSTFSLNQTGTASGYMVNIFNTSAFGNGMWVQTVEGTAVKGYSPIGGIGVEGQSEGYGVYGHTVAGVGVFAQTSDNSLALWARSPGSGGGIAAKLEVNDATNTTVVPIVQVVRATDPSPGANGIGGSIDFMTETTTGASQISNTIVSKWTTATNASRTSQFIITGINSAASNDILALNGNGSAQLYDYGDGTFTGTATKWLAVDVNGNLIEENPPSGSITADNGLTMSTSTNVQLGGTLLQNTTIDATSSFYLLVSGSRTGAGTGVLRAEHSGTSGAAIVGSTSASSSGSSGVYGSATSGIGITGVSNDGVAAELRRNASTDNDAVRIAVLVRQTTATPADGIGGYIEMQNQNTTGGSNMSHQIISKWTTAAFATRTSQFIIAGVNSATTQNLLVLDGNGQATLSQYTGTNFNTAQAKVAMVGTDGKLYAVDTTGLFGGGGGGSGTIDGAIADEQVAFGDGTDAIQGSDNLKYNASLLTSLSAGLGVTQDDAKGIVLINTTAAAAGAQQISPSVRWSAQGWKTNATAASQEVEFRAFVLPVQGTNNPTATWQLEFAINGGGYDPVLRINSQQAFAFGASSVASAANTIAWMGSTSSGIGAVTFSSNATNAGDNSFIASGQNSTIAANNVGGVIIGTDATLSALADYAVNGGDANDAFAESSTTFGFGNDNYVQNGLTVGNANVNGALSAGGGTGNQYTDSWMIGTQNRSTGNYNGTLGRLLQTTGVGSITIGHGIVGSSTRLVNSAPSRIAFGTNSDSATVIIDAAAGTTGTYGVTGIRGQLNLGVAGQSSGVFTTSGSTSGTITIQPAAAAGTWTWTLPTNDGDADQVLTTNGSGVTSWTTVSGSGISLAAVGSSPNANAATLSGSTLNLEPASASFPGVVTTGTQTMAGDKTFSGQMRINNELLINITDQGTAKLQMDGDALIYGATSDGSTPVLRMMSAAGAQRFRFNSDGKLIFGTATTSNAIIEIVDETLPFIIRNSGSGGYTRLQARNDQNSASRAMEWGYTGSAYGAYWTSGYSGEQGLLGTTGNQPLTIATNNTQRIIISNGGTVTIGDLAGTGSRTVLADANGLLSAPVSDRSVKQFIKPLEQGLSTIMKLNPVSFEYKDGWKNYGSGTQIGFIAQDIQKVMPNSVFTTSSTGKMGYNEIDIIPVLVKAMQEQQREIENLKHEINKLKKVK